MNRKVLLIATCALIVVGAVAVKFSIGMGAIPVVKIGGESVEESQNRVRGNIDISEFDTLTIDASTVDVRILEGDAYKLEYNVKEKYVPEVSQNGKNLTVKQPSLKPEIAFFDVDLTALKEGESSYTITVPKDTAPINVDVKASTDDVVIDGVDVNGKVVSDADSITLSNVSSSNLYVKCSAGKIKLDYSEFDKLELESSSDDIIVENCTINDLAADSSSDKITLNYVKLNTANLKALDDIVIDIVGQNDYSLNLKSSTGEDIIVEGNTVEGSFKSDNGSGKSITAKSSTGKIKVSFANE